MDFIGLGKLFDGLFESSCTFLLHFFQQFPFILFFKEGTGIGRLHFYQILLFYIEEGDKLPGRQKYLIMKILHVKITSRNQHAFGVKFPILR